jgi:hypothetical protein
MVRPRPLRLVMVVFATLLLVASAFGILTTSPPLVRGSSSSVLHDDFTRDSVLNSSLWQVNGPVGTVLGPDDAGITIVPLVPAFSSNGMEIAQINASQEVGTIESLNSFTPPFTATATVEAIVSNGHTFGLAIASANASSGVLVYGNVNPTNCSNLVDCGNPSTCGTSANSGIPPNQCYYGIDAKIGSGGGSWKHIAKLYLTPSANVTYTLQISVDPSGNAQFGVSQGGLGLGVSSAQIGTGPFYVIMEQAEGSPVAHPGSNQALWMSVSVIPTTTTISASTTISPGPVSSSIPLTYVFIIVIVVLLLIVLLWFLRRGGFTVEVQDNGTRSPTQGASVLADGPKSLSGITEKDGKVKFGRVKEGDYTVKATAEGFLPSTPATIKVKNKTEYTVLLSRIPPVTQVSAPASAPPMVPLPSPETQQPPATVTQPVQQGPAPAVAQPVPLPEPSVEARPEEQDDMGGGRINEIIRKFQAKGAISPETALTAEELGLSRLFVRIMKRRKGKTTFFMEINGKYYLNQKALEERK